MANYTEQVAALYKNAPILGKDISSKSEAPAIRVPDLHEYEQLLSEIFADFNWEPERQAASVAHHVEHEGQHAFAAKAVGATVTGFCARLWRSEEGLNAFYPYTAIDCKALGGSALLYASILLYPTEPSDGDLSMADGIGYGVANLGAEATEHNATHENTIPVPLSYIPSTRMIIDLSPRAVA